MVLEMDAASFSSEETPLVSRKSNSNRKSDNDSKQSGLQAAKSVKQVIRSSLSTFYDDDFSDMTLSRRIALALYYNPWYYPDSKRRLHGDSALANAWAYFEHSTLCRYEKRHDLRSNRKEVGLDNFHFNYADTDKYPRAKSGEKCENTRLYPIIDTPEADLADYGMGVGSYFFTLRILSIIMLCAGILSLPNIFYYASDSYNVESHDSLSLLGLRTSAICTAQRWEACPTCSKHEFKDFPTTYERYAEATLPDGVTVLKFIRINECQVNRMVGMVSCGTMVAVCVAIFSLLVAARLKELEFDASMQTTKDYSVEVVNPPGGAKSADDWRAFFGQFGHVTSLTIAYDNEKILVALTKRQKFVKMLENLQPTSVLIPHDVSIEDAVANALHVPLFQKMCGAMDAISVKLQINKLGEQINELSEREYKVIKIFVIFETEEAQQAALRALQVPGLQIFLQSKSNRPDNLLFEHDGKKHLLQVVEPCEPSGVRWKDLDESYRVQITQRFFTMIATILVILLGCAIVVYVRLRYGVIYAAICVSVLTSGAPITLRALASLESHPSESSRESSLYYKITAFHWIATAMLTSLITPFVESLDTDHEALIPAMYAIFISELITKPLIQILDIEGNFNRHILAPRAKNAKAMIQYFQGTAYFLSERYTNMTGVLFLTCFYSLLFPAGFFLASATLCVHFWCDKFCLLRTWARRPMINTDMAVISRQFFFTTALIVYVLISSYYFALFPFDNACAGSSRIPSNYVGAYIITNGENKTQAIELTNDDIEYYFCEQNLFQYSPPAFPATPAKQPQGHEWMTEDQEFAYTYAYVSVTIAGFLILVILFAIWTRIRGFFLSPFRPHVDAFTPKSFSCISDINAYIPQAKLPTDPFPVLFCYVSDIAEDLIPWVDPEHSYRFHNAIYDLPDLSDKPVFSTVHYWAPPAETNGSNHHHANDHGHDLHSHHDDSDFAVSLN